jgi:tetratricopeptide (TPR) repeat protein
MAKRKVAQEEEVVTQQVQETSAPFWVTYQKQIIYAVGGVLALFLCWWGYKALIVEPKQKEAVESMWQAQMQFERDSFKLALENPAPDADGFLAIIDKFSGTKAANAATYYAGVCYMQTGDFDNAIKYMEDYDADGDLFPIMKYGILGDCYSEKQDFAKALDMYEKASDSGNNDVLAAVYLKKLGLLNEKQGNKEAAVKAFQRLHRDFPNPSSSDWRDVEKYIYKNGGGE